MRVILTETGERFFPNIPLALTPLLGKPLLERVIEYWVARGATHFHCLLSPDSGRLSRQLGGGEKWGVQLSCEVPQESSSQEMVIVGSLEHFPPPEGLAEFPCFLTDLEGDWCGWAHLPWKEAQDLLNGNVDRVSVTRVVHTKRSVSSRYAYQALQLFLLRTGCVEARQVGDGVWLAPGARVHPSAALHGPVYVGENSWVGPRVILGPGTIVGENCQIAKGCKLGESWVKPGTPVRAGRASFGEYLSEEQGLFQRLFRIRFS